MSSPELASNTDPVSFVSGRNPKLLAGKATSDSGPKAERDRPHLLWIDDERDPADSTVRLLELHGFRIRCSQTGTEGLALARAGDYRAILLDLRLPDIPGLSVLAHLRGDRVKTPVVVVTGFPGTESALVAGRLGAGACHWILDPVEELAATIQRLIRAPELAPPSLPSLGGDMGLDLQSPAFNALAALIEALDRLTQPTVEALAGSEKRVMIRQALTKALLRALFESSLPAALFLACAAALKLVADADQTESPFRLADRAQGLILKTLSRCAPKDSRVVAALEMLASAAAQHRRLKLEDAAGAMTQRIRPERLGTLIQEQTGFWYTEWRTAFLIRPSVVPLLSTDADVKQIVPLTFKTVDHFDHEFHRFFGLTPTRFRETTRLPPQVAFPSFCQHISRNRQ